MSEPLSRETIEKVLAEICEQSETPMVIFAFELESDGAVAAWTRNTACRLEAWLARNAFSRIALAIELIDRIVAPCGFAAEGWSEPVSDERDDDEREAA